MTVLNNRTRFLNTIHFKSVDRLPCIEWAVWWDQTLNRWKGEGLPEDLQNPVEIMEFFGLDLHKQFWFTPLTSAFQKKLAQSNHRIGTMDDYYKMKESLYPDIQSTLNTLSEWRIPQERGEVILWITLEGFFWFPRALLGVQEHLYAFYDQPELIHRINQDLVDYHIHVLDEFCRICTPDFLTVAEDMTYNNGPIISKKLFDEFIAPYYRQLIPHIIDRGIVPFIDTDGDVSSVIPWFEQLQVDAFLPFERHAGLDIKTLRNNHPELRIIGGFDKRVISRTETEMRAEFDRLLPVMKQGGFIPSVDHQTPPEVSFENYLLYVRLLKEYCTIIFGSVGSSRQ